MKKVCLHDMKMMELTLKGKKGKWDEALTKVIRRSTIKVAQNSLHALPKSKLSFYEAVHFMLC